MLLVFFISLSNRFSFLFNICQIEKHCKKAFILYRHCTMKRYEKISGMNYLRPPDRDEITKCSAVAGFNKVGDYFHLRSRHAD